VTLLKNVEIEQDALTLLGDIGARTSLQYSVQMLTPARFQIGVATEPWHCCHLHLLMTIVESGVAVTIFLDVVGTEAAVPIQVISVSAAIGLFCRSSTWASGHLYSSSCHHRHGHHGCCPVRCSRCHSPTIYLFLP
jgi:hypothetical protein